MRIHENVSAFFGSGPDGGQLKQDTCKKIKNDVCTIKSDLYHKTSISFVFFAIFIIRFSNKWIKEDIYDKEKISGNGGGYYPICMCQHGSRANRQSGCRRTNHGIWREPKFTKRLRRQG